MRSSSKLGIEPSGLFFDRAFSCLTPTVLITSEDKFPPTSSLRPVSRDARHKFFECFSWWRPILDDLVAAAELHYALMSKVVTWALAT